MNNGSKERAEIARIGMAQQVRTEGERSEPEIDRKPDKSADTLNSQGIPDPEVMEKIAKRKFSIDYKARIVREANACTEPGQIGALLRREGLYSSQLAMWRRAYERGALAGLRDNKRGPKRTRHPLEKENEKLKKENALLERRLKQAQVIIDVQKKLSGLLGIPLQSEESEGEH